MGDDKSSRLVAWEVELTRAHERLRRALQIARDAGDAGTRDVVGRELLLYCHGFCLALRGHHESENTGLFPELRARHPHLEPVINRLEEDHAMIAALLQDLDQGLEPTVSADEAQRRLDGIAAVMESHFRYEERQLLDVLAALDLDAEPESLIGPL